eukprot:363931-Chlamydomonas_euryale.AAC.1
MGSQVSGTTVGQASRLNGRSGERNNRWANERAKGQAGFANSESGVTAATAALWTAADGSKIVVVPPG